MHEPVRSQILHEMMSYYKARAYEYDEWFYRLGRYELGQEANTRWFAEADQVFTILEALKIEGHILELAPGTGIWTERFLRTASSITAVDASPEMIAINQARVGRDRVSYLQADLFSWQPTIRYDAVCFCFWLSHVPIEQLDIFLSSVAMALRPGGKVFFVDSHRATSDSPVEHELPEEHIQIERRRLNDGREFNIVKNYYEPLSLAARFASSGFDIFVRETETYFLYGYGTLESSLA